MKVAQRFDAEMMDIAATSICVEVWVFAMIFDCIHVVAEGNFVLKEPIKKKRRQARVDELPDSVHVTCAPDCLMRIVFDMIMKGPNEQHEGLIRAKLVSHCLGKKISSINVKICFSPGEGETECLALWRGDDDVILATSGDGDFRPCSSARRLLWRIYSESIGFMLSKGPKRFSLGPRLLQRSRHSSDIDFVQCPLALSIFQPAAGVCGASP